MQVTVVLGETVERVEVPEEELLSFPRGVIGFEEFTRYALFELEQPLYLLQAVEDPDVGFLLLDPLLVAPGYDASLSGDDRALLKVRSARQTKLLSVVTLSAEGTPATVNLRAPLAINLEQGLGTQIIPQESAYPVRYPLPVSPEGELMLDAPTSGRSGRAGGRRNGSRERQEATRCLS